MVGVPGLDRMIVMAFSVRVDHEEIYRGLVRHGGHRVDRARAHARNSEEKYRDDIPWGAVCVHEYMTCCRDKRVRERELSSASPKVHPTRRLVDRDVADRGGISVVDVDLFCASVPGSHRRRYLQILTGHHDLPVRAVGFQDCPLARCGG